jgi:hypothetical protein
MPNGLDFLLLDVQHNSNLVLGTTFCELLGQNILVQSQMPIFNHPAKLKIFKKPNFNKMFRKI